MNLKKAISTAKINKDRRKYPNHVACMVRKQLEKYTTSAWTSCISTKLILWAKIVHGPHDEFLEKAQNPTLKCFKLCSRIRSVCCWQSLTSVNYLGALVCIDLFACSQQHASFKRFLYYFLRINLQCNGLQSTILILLQDNCTHSETILAGFDQNKISTAFCYVDPVWKNTCSI